MPPPRGATPAQKTRTVEWREWKGLNLTDARVAIDDGELAWSENALTIGRGAIQLLPGPGPSVFDNLGGGIFSLWGFTLNGNPVMIAVNTDGSMTQITPGGAVTAVAAAGSVTTAAHLAIWQGSPILIIDPTKGYSKWDGSAYTVISAGTKGVAIAVFEGRVWISNNRTTTFTAPNTFDSFVAGDGAGSFILTDEAFPGNITALVSALEELWIVGQGAVDALANVVSSGTSPNVVTVFSVTNIVTNLGTGAPNSVIGYFRALTFFAPYGAYALSGVTPQKLSDALDLFLPDLTLVPDIPAAIGTVESLQALLFLVLYNGGNAVGGAVPLAMVLGFIKGRWFQAVQNNSAGSNLRWITTLIIGGVSQAWGTNGTQVYQLFGAALSTSVRYKVQSKLEKITNSTQAKAVTKMGFEYQAAFPVAPTLTCDSESGSVPVSVTQGNLITKVNNAGAPIVLTNNLGVQITKVAQGMVLSRSDVAQSGHYLGWTLTGSDPPYRVQAIQMEITPTREWSTP